MQKGTISVQTENIFPIIKKFLYSDQEIFLRELISNAVDASTKLQTLAAKGVFKGELGDLTIEVEVDKEAGILKVIDRGIGMTEEEVLKYLNQVAFSSAADFLKKYKDDSNIIGHFGLGFYSAFMVADKIEVISKSYKKTVKAVHWTCEGNPEFTLDTHVKKDRGTEIILHISDESKEFLEKQRIEQLLKKYCKFLPIPIQFGTRTETRYEGEGDDKKEISEDTPNIINNTDPLWKKQPSRIKEDAYKAFYNELYPFSPAPLFWIHLNIDYPFNLTGILYFPKLHNALEVQKNKIQLYSNQVYVTDDVKEIVPEFLTLLHGVIDSPDIPLNVSRSYLQSDSNVRKITSYITKKVAEQLKKLHDKKRESYIEKWDDIGVFVKYGMISDEKFHDRATDFCLMKNTNGDYFNLEAYKEKVENTQKDKNGSLIYLYTHDPKEHDSYIRHAEEYGYDVLVFDHIIDNHWIQHMEYKLENTRFVRVDSDTVDQLIQKEETPEPVLSDEEQGKIKSLFEAFVPKDKQNLQVKSLSPKAHPVVITKPEYLRRMQEMQNLQGMPLQEMPGMFNVVINANHPLVAGKLLRMRSQEKKAKFAKYLFDLARLNQNMLKGSDLTEFIEESIELMEY